LEVYGFFVFYFFLDFRFSLFPLPFHVNFFSPGAAFEFLSFFFFSKL